MAFLNGGLKGHETKFFLFYGLRANACHAGHNGPLETYFHNVMSFSKQTCLLPQHGVLVKLVSRVGRVNHTESPQNEPEHIFNFVESTPNVSSTT